MFALYKSLFLSRLYMKNLFVRHSLGVLFQYPLAYSFNSSNMHVFCLYVLLVYHVLGFHVYAHITFEKNFASLIYFR